MAFNDIQLTAGMRNNLLTLQGTQVKLDRTQQILATGNKVNSALDGPAAFFAAKGLNQRASDLASLKDAMGQAITTIKAGDKGITSISDLIEQARGLTTQAYASLGNDSASTATRASLAKQFNAIKDQIDKLAKDSSYGGKNLLLGDGVKLDANATTVNNVDAITGLNSIRTTNVAAADKYVVAVSGDGVIKGNSADMANAALNRGFSSINISGTASTTAGNFSDVSIEVRGAAGKARGITVSEAGVSYTPTLTFFANDQQVTDNFTAGSAGGSATAAVTLAGTVDAGDTFTVSFGGVTATYTVLGTEGATITAVASAAQAYFSNVFSAANGTLGATATVTETGGVISFTALSSATGASTATATNAETATVSYTFASGTYVSFTLDRIAMDATANGGAGTSTIEKNVNISIKVTDNNGAGVTIERNAAFARGDGKLTDGENSFAFGNATVRFNVDQRVITSAATGASSATLNTEQKTDSSDANDLTVQFNESNTSKIQVVSQNVQTDGRGLRLDYAQNNWTDRADIDKAVASIDYAKTTLRNASSQLSTNLNIIQSREDFTKEFTNTLTEGANKLTLADANEQGANMLALQTRSQLGTISLSLANQSQQAILRLF